MPVAGAVIGAVGSIAGGQAGARGAERAADAQVQGQRDAIQAQLAMYNQSRADQMPMIQARNAALPLFMQLLGLNPSSINMGSPTAGGVQMGIEGEYDAPGWKDNMRENHWIRGDNIQENRNMFWNPFKAPSHTRDTVRNDWHILTGQAMEDDPGQATFTYDEAGNVVGQTPAASGYQPIDLQSLIASTPGYQFQLGEGLNAIDRSASARGGLMSGATIRAAQRYGTGLASNEFGNFANRLASLMGIGQTAANAAGGYGMQTGQAVGQNLANIGGARGSGYANQANIWGNTIGSVANQFGNYFNNAGGGQTTNVPASFTTNYSPDYTAYGNMGGGGN